MTALTIRQDAAGEQAELTIFRACCLASARQYAGGEIDLQSAVDSCQQLAENLGLIVSIGQDAVQAIMANVFGGANDLTIDSSIDHLPLRKSGAEAQGDILIARRRHA